MCVYGCVNLIEYKNEFPTRDLPSKNVWKSPNKIKKKKIMFAFQHILVVTRVGDKLIYQFVLLVSLLCVSLLLFFVGLLVIQWLRVRELKCGMVGEFLMPFNYYIVVLRKEVIKVNDNFLNHPTLMTNATRNEQQIMLHYPCY